MDLVQQVSKKYLEKAIQYSKLSTCPKMEVGAILIREGKMIASGYNGAPIGLSHCEEIEPTCYEHENHCQNSLHAEQAILLYCARNGIKTDKSLLYITHYPCKNCTRFLIQAGILKVYYKYDYKNYENIFKNDLKIIKVNDYEWNSNFL